MYNLYVTNKEPEQKCNETKIVFYLVDFRKCHLNNKLILLSTTSTKSS